MQDNKSCKNCSFYKPHYSIDNCGRYYILNTGHCTCEKVGIMTFKRTMKWQGACPLWKFGEEVTPLESLSDSVFEIKQLLKDLVQKIVSIQLPTNDS